MLYKFKEKYGAFNFINYEKKPCKRVSLNIRCEAAFDAVDTPEISWKRLEDYIWKWYPVLNNRSYAYL